MAQTTKITTAITTIPALRQALRKYTSSKTAPTDPAISKIWVGFLNANFGLPHEAIAMLNPQIVWHRWWPGIKLGMERGSGDLSFEIHLGVDDTINAIVPSLAEIKLIIPCTLDNDRPPYRFNVMCTSVAQLHTVLQGWVDSMHTASVHEHTRLIKEGQLLESQRTTLRVSSDVLGK